MRKAISIIDAPSALGLGRTGVDRLPDALRAAGLLDGVDEVRYAGRLSVPPDHRIRDKTSGILNSEAIRTFSCSLAERVDSVLERNRFPLVLGGDCSILFGPALSLRRRGRFGLFFIDGHADYYSPESEPNGEVASMDLAVVTGRGPAALADFDGQRPLVRELDAVVFGFRDAEAAVAHGSPDVRHTQMCVIDLAEVRRLGPVDAARVGMSALESSDVDGFWLHLDADVLNDEVMPAVDYRMPDGLWPDELLAALKVVLSSPLAVGMDVTIYNPALDDANCSAAQVLARVVTRAFKS